MFENLLISSTIYDTHTIAHRRRDVTILFSIDDLFSTIARKNSLVRKFRNGMWQWNMQWNVDVSACPPTWARQPLKISALQEPKVLAVEPVGVVRESCRCENVKTIGHHG